MRFFVSVFMAILAIFIGMNACAHAQTDLTPQQRAQLEAQLAQVEAEQKQAEADLVKAKNESASLSRDIRVLDAKIKAAQLDIKAKNLLIQSLGNDIKTKKSIISDLDARIERGKETLSQILRKTNEIDQYSLPEIVLSRNTISGFFQDIDDFGSVSKSLQDTFDQLRSNIAETTAQKEALTNRQNAEIDAKYVIEQEQKNIQADEKKKMNLLAVSKGNESSYSKVVADRSAKAAEIRATLFSLRDSKAIRFDVALRYANEAYRSTGIRPAFLLAIFAQESGLDEDSTFGKQLGSCYLTDISTGAGASVKSGRTFPNVMKPSRDVQPFLSITEALGLDYKDTYVSCPQTARTYGGAMGPAQFIPSTWVLYVDRIKRALGIGTAPNPWNPEHAFVAASLLLVDNGAKYNSYTSEKNAACKYYSGSSCGASSMANTYGTQVMSKAATIQRTMIDPLQDY